MSRLRYHAVQGGERFRDYPELLTEISRLTAGEETAYWTRCHQPRRQTLSKWRGARGPRVFLTHSSHPLTRNQIEALERKVSTRMDLAK